MLTEEETVLIIYQIQASCNIILMMMQALIICSRKRKIAIRANLRQPRVDRILARRDHIAQLVTDNDNDCFEQLRIRIAPFHRLVQRLRGFGLKDSRSVTVEEQMDQNMLSIGAATNARQKRRRSLPGYDKYDDTLLLMAEAANDMSTSVKELTSTLKKPALPRLLGILKGIPELSYGDITRAMIVFGRDLSAADILVSMEEGMRYEFVRSMLG